jgi:hypothetical protein
MYTIHISRFKIWYFLCRVEFNVFQIETLQYWSTHYCL